PLMLGLGLVGRDDRDHLDLLELVLADEAARIAPRRARFGAETGSERGEAQRQFALGEDLLADDIGEADLGGGDQPATVSRPERILGELRKLAGAEHRLVAAEAGRGGL